MPFGILKTSRSVRHAMWSMLDAALYPVIYLATVPLLMRGMGMLTFGFWILLNSLITILQLFNFNSGIANMGVTIIQRISAAVVNKDTQQVNDIINSTLHITLALLIFITGIGFFLSFAAVHYGWWDINKLQGLDVASCILLTALISGLKYFDQIFQSVIRAYEHFRLSSVLNMINRFGLLAITLFLAVSGYSLLWILWSNIIFIVAYLLTELLCIKKLIPGYRPGLSEDRKLYKRLLHFNMWPWLQSVIIVFTFQTDRFWVSSYLGLKVVSAYGLVSTMFNHVHMIFTAMILWVLPRIAIMTSKGKDAARLYYTVRAAALGIIIISLLLFYFAAPTLLRIWTGADTAAYLLEYVKYFIAFEIVFAHSIMPFFYLNAVGKNKLAAWLTLFYCSINYVCMLAGLFFFHSATAMITGMTVALCVTMPVVNAVIRKNIYGAYSWRTDILEMLPMYAAVLLLYTNDNIMLLTGFAAVVVILIWKFYLSNLFSEKIWQRAPYL